MKTNHKIIIGDSRSMEEISNESVHLVVTSPPYWQLKDYANGKQIGFNDSYEEYINNLNLVWNECQRVLHKGCRMCINIGDQFARSVYYGRYKVIPIRTEVIKFCEAVGFDYMGAIIWQKVTTTNTTGGATIMGSFPFPRNGILKIDYEFILIFKKYGKSPSVSKEIKAKSKLTKEEWNKFFTGHWNFSGERQDKHLAMFPEELPKRIIKMFSFFGDTVLDPFLGSGTTSLAAKNQNRNSIGFEINGEYDELIREKLNMKQSDIFQESTISIDVQKQMNNNLNTKRKSLPYIFKDPIKFDKKTDPRKLTFGSKIDNNNGEREEYFRIEKVMSPELILLNNGLKIRLIGIKEIPQKQQEAIQFIIEKTKGQKVYLKYDSEKFDSENNMLCYLYLKNRTFLNAHLIKYNLADVDTSSNFRLKTKFLGYSEIRHG